MADLLVVLLLIVLCVAFLQGVTGDSVNVTKNASQMMQKFGEENKCDKQTARAVEQLTIKIQELQEKLQSAELRIKDEVRRQHETENTLGCSVLTSQLEKSTSRLETKLDNYRNETLSYMRDISVCLAKNFEYERNKLEKSINNSENEMLKEEISFCTTESQNKTKKLLQMQSNLDICRNASEILHKNVSEHVNVYNNLTVSAETNNKTNEYSKTKSLETCNDNSTKFKNTIETLKITLESCNNDLKNTKSRVEKVNAAVESGQADFDICVKTSEERKIKLEECTNQMIVTEKSHKSKLQALNSQLQLVKKASQSCESKLKVIMTKRDKLVRTTGGKVFTILNEEKVVIMKYVNWEPAADICSSIGMKLISLQTRDKWMAIQSYLQNNGYANKYFWTSGRKFDDSWTWTATDEDIKFKAWMTGEPDDIGDVCIRFETDGRGWSDYRCGFDSNYVICEY